MDVIIINSHGILMCVVAFGIAFGVGKAFGLSGDGPLMIIAGTVLAAFDIAYRLFADDGHLLVPSRGGSLFYLPAWCFGVFWLIVGIVYTVQASAA